MRTRTVAGSVVLALLVLAGCSGDDAGPSAAPPPTAAADDTFASTSDLLAALGRSGVPCEQPQQGSFPQVSQALSCVVNEAEDVVLLVFSSAAERDRYLAAMDELASLALGDNWAVQTVLRETAEQIAAAIGGEVVSPAS
jgi:hypothetical protein